MTTCKNTTKYPGRNCIPDTDVFKTRPTELGAFEMLLDTLGTIVVIFTH